MNEKNQMNEPQRLGEILKDYFLNSQEPLAVAYRAHIANSDDCPLCRQSPQTPPEQTKLSDWLDGQDVMQALHISPRTLQTLRTNGTLPHSRIGGKLYYKRSDILRILQDNYTMFKIRNNGNK
jgi:hypothetical protein